MYHITRTKSLKKPFQVVNVDNVNSEVINTSQPLTSKQKCLKNIIANMDTIFSESDAPYYVNVQDDTGKKPVAFKLYDDGTKNFDIEAKPKYIPGKNPKKR